MSRRLGRDEYEEDEAYDGYGGLPSEVEDDEALGNLPLPSKAGHGIPRLGLSGR